MPCRRKKSEDLDEIQIKILKALSTMKEPDGCGEIVKAAGLPTPKVTGKLRGLKSRGLVNSPIKGKYIITEEGKKKI